MPGLGIVKAPARQSLLYTVYGLLPPSSHRRYTLDFQWLIISKLTIHSTHLDWISLIIDVEMSFNWNGNRDVKGLRYACSLNKCVSLCRCKVLVHGCKPTGCLLQETAPLQTLHWGMGEAWRPQEVTSENCIFSRPCLPCIIFQMFQWQWISFQYLLNYSAGNFEKNISPVIFLFLLLLEVCGSFTINKSSFRCRLVFKLWVGNWIFRGHTFIVSPSLCLVYEPQ